MIENRRNYNARRQYIKVFNCYYHCTQEKCRDYTPNINSNNCLWYDVLLNDRGKIGTNKPLTFPILEKILKKENESL